MTTIIPCKDCDTVEIQHEKDDDLLIVLELLKEEDEEPFDPELLDLSWTILKDSVVLITIEGDDLTIENNYVQFHKDKASFSALNFLENYTHKLYENGTNTTLLEGKFQLK